MLFGYANSSYIPSSTSWNLFSCHPDMPIALGLWQSLGLFWSFCVFNFSKVCDKYILSKLSFGITEWSPQQIWTHRTSYAPTVPFPFLCKISPLITWILTPASPPRKHKLLHRTWIRHETNTRHQKSSKSKKWGHDTWPCMYVYV